jgi:patatin-like phospholipase/acyl hydrolase
MMEYALDGCGVRGVSALLILEQLMEAVDPDALPKPCDYFDVIGKTSTGGFWHASTLWDGLRWEN